MKRILARLIPLLLLLAALAGCALPAAGPEGSGSASVSVSGAVSAPAQSRSEPGQPAAVREDGHYTSPEDVAAYLQAYGRLPANYISKTKARKLGWDSGLDLWDYAPGMSIGGGPYGNYEGTLPDGTAYRECDVNYAGGHRGAERIVYGEDGSIWYTADHYQTFTRMDAAR